MTHLFHYHPHIYVEKKLRRLFLSRVLRTASVTFLTLFSAIYVYQKSLEFGYSHEQSIGLAAGFYLVLFSSKLLGLFFGENISQKIGLKRTIQISIIPFTFLIIALLFAQTVSHLMLGAAAWGLHAGLFWWSYHAYFASVGNVKHFGRDVGQVLFFDTVTAFVTPFLGAFVIESFGYETSYVVAFIIAFVATLSIGTENDKKLGIDVRFTEVVKNFFKKMSFTVGYVGLAGETVLYNVVWPLFVYLYFDSILDLGLFLSVSSLLSGIVVYFVGKYSDYHGEKSGMVVSSWLLSLQWMLRLIVISLPIFLVTEATRQFSAKSLSLIQVELNYKKSQRNIALSILTREFGVIVGAICASLSIVILTYLGISLQNLFIIALVCSIITVFVASKYKNE